jgi:hypothetical protein
LPELLQILLNVDQLLFKVAVEEIGALDGCKERIKKDSDENA